MRSKQSFDNRVNQTLQLLEGFVPKGARILDLGVPSEMSERMSSRGYIISNTGGENLDDDQSSVMKQGYDSVTSFEVFEHLLAPYNVLKAIEAPKLVATVPLSLWFKSAYWNDNDPWDCHYHEFEPKQFLMLLERTGWKVEKVVYWKDTAPVTGIRPLLRRTVPRYMGVVCERV
jgi:hypothetical protein